VSTDFTAYLEAHSAAYYATFGGTIDPAYYATFHAT
jgi:hypothetical protein